MGPREFTRGDHASGMTPSSSLAALQWGRGSSPAETLVGDRRAREVNAASMGPREFTRGDPDLVAAVGRELPASMGPREFTRGDISTQV